MIVNLTQHNLTKEQIEAGAYEPQADNAAEIRRLLNFSAAPTAAEIIARAEALADIAAEETGAIVSGALIGGAPYLMGPLEWALRDRGVTPYYAFSERVSVEETLSDGSVRKTNVFRHQGWLEGAF